MLDLTSLHGASAALKDGIAGYQNAKDASRTYAKVLEDAGYPNHFTGSLTNELRIASLVWTLNNQNTLLQFYAQYNRLIKDTVAKLHDGAQANHSGDFTALK